MTAKLSAHAEANLSSAIAEVLQRALELGLKLPFTIVAIGVNGSISAVRFESAGDHLQPVDIYTSNAAIALPINIAIIESVGEAMRVVITAEGALRLMN